MANANANVILTRFERFLDCHDVIGGRALVAVSGGPDSISLALALHELSKRYQLTPVVAHLNHRLRGLESDADAAFVEQFCREGSLSFVIDQVKDGELIPEQSHLESTARRLRYRWLATVAGREGCRWVMTGHTANDQAETVLHHLLRGTGWRGLRGIAPRRSLGRTPHPNPPPQAGREQVAQGGSDQVPSGGRVVLLRPLLEATREEIETFLAERGIRARKDRTNDDLKYLRNRLRHRVLPLLQTEVNPQVVRHLAQLAARARRVYAGIRRQATTLLRQAALPPASPTLVYDGGTLAQATNDVLQEALRQLWCQQRWPVAAMSAARWREVMEVCRGERTAIQLPTGVVARRKLHVVHFFPAG